jgi:hypothetical protein
VPRGAAASAEVAVDKPVSDPNAIGREFTHRLELAVVIIISASALVTSWASYEANLWSRKQTLSYGLSGAHRVMATRAALDASVNRTMEVGLLDAWMAAREAGNQRLATFYERRFPPDFQPAFQEWLAQRPFENPQAAPSPFRLPSYRPAGVSDAQRLEAQASAEFQEGQRSSTVAASFIRGGVILAMAMFFGGVGQVFAARNLRIVMAVMAFLSCAVGLLQIFTLPVLSLRW